MNKRKLYKVIALLLSMVMLFMVVAPYTLAYIDDATKPVVNTFTPRDIESSDVIVKKTVTHPFGEDYEIPENIAFDFKLEFGSYYSGYSFETTYGTLKADENGSITVAVRPGVPLGISGVEQGSAVTVTELSKEGSGFTVQGEATRSATVETEEPVVFDYVNVYEPAAAKATNVTLTGIKKLEGRDWQEGDSFSFKLEMKQGAEWKSLGTKTITSGQADFSFNDIIQVLEFDQAGTYSFRICEIIGDAENLTYDRTINRFALAVTDLDMDGKLAVTDATGTENVTVAKSEGQFDLAVTFSNVFTPAPVVIPDDITVPVTVQKTVKNTGKKTLSPEGFVFVLQNLETDDRVIRKTDANGQTVFTLGFSAEDVGKTYSYKLTESNDGRENVTYSTAVYNIQIAVSENEAHQLVTAITVNGKAVDSVTATFENIYDTRGVAAPDTGDHTHVQLYILLAALSAAAIALLLVFRKKVQFFIY